MARLLVIRRKTEEAIYEIEGDAHKADMIAENCKTLDCIPSKATFLQNRTYVEYDCEAAQ